MRQPTKLELDTMSLNELLDECALHTADTTRLVTHEIIKNYYSVFPQPDRLKQYLKQQLIAINQTFRMVQKGDI